SRALVSAGKVSEKNIISLVNPGIFEFDAAIDRLAKNKTQKFMFYFSGHSDEHGLHLKDGAVTKSKFHDLLSKVDSKVKIVVLDSCFSGALKSKGVKKAAPIELVQYNVDEPTGSVILTSSSGTELSYESDRLKGSIFTYHLVSGLYGQADINADGLVTIDELYQYVYSQTKFQNVVSGGKVQSPEFESKLTGQGALVVSYPARINGQIALADPMQGELTLTAAKGLNFFKFYKNKGEGKVLSVPKGNYEVTLVDESRIGTGKMEVTENQTRSLSSETLVWEKRDIPPVRAKGVHAAFLFGAMIGSHPTFNNYEMDSMMFEFYAKSPAAKALWGNWRLAVHLGSEGHEVVGSPGEKNEYSRMSIGGEGSYSGWNAIKNEWLIGLRVGTYTSNSNTSTPISASLTHFHIGTRFYPESLPITWDIQLGSDTIKYGNNGQDKNVGTLSVAVGF
ncbi:MAG: caspase family protein, partial [Bdellovibrionia bacterium]